MKIKIDKVLTNLNSEPLKEEEKEITLGMVLGAALLTGGTKEPERAYQLAAQLGHSDEIELKAEDILFIKECIKNTNLPVLYSGQAITLLDA